jgi:hypothetical protein
MAQVTVDIVVIMVSIALLTGCRQHFPEPGEPIAQPQAGPQSTGEQGEIQERN